MPKEMPKDFSFSLTWGVYGTSSYNSRTGKLVKTTDATHPEDYVTYLRLSDETLDYIYGLLIDLNIDSYPDEYNPDPFTATTPSSALILTVRAGGKTKTIKADDIALSHELLLFKGKRYIETCDFICDLIMSTEEWKALPDYEFYYD